MERRVETVELRRHMQHKQKSERIMQKELGKQSGQIVLRSYVGVDGHCVLYWARWLQKNWTLYKNYYLLTMINVSM